MMPGDEYYDDPYESTLIADQDARGIVQLSNAISQWTSTRDLPSWGWIFAWLVLAGFPLSLVVLGSLANSSTWAERYRLALEEACDEEDLNRASVLHGKLVDIDASDPELTYRYARLLEDDGQLDQAQIWMERLAPNAEGGYFGAHLWLAGKLVEEKPRLTPDESREFAARLRYVLSDQPENLNAHAMYGVVLEQSGNLDEAEAHLQLAATTRRDASIPLARVRARLGKMDSAKREAEFAVQHFSEELHEEPQNIETRIELAKALMFLEKWSDAELVLVTGHTDQDDPRIKKQLVQTYMAAAGVFARRVESRNQVVPLLLRALEVEPDDEFVLARLLDATDSQSQLPDEVSSRLIKQLQSAVEIAPDEIPLHSKLGQLYLVRKEYDQAVAEFEFCAERRPVMNLDLAHTLNAAGRPDEARKAAALAAGEFARLEQEGTLPNPVRLLWANALSLQGRAADAVQVLRDGLQHDPKSQFLHTALSNQLFEQYVALRAKETQLTASDTHTDNALNVLLDAVRHDPRNRQAVSELARLMDGNGEQQDKVESLFRTLLAEGRATSVVHMLLGTRAAQRQDLRAARFHLEQALPEHRDRPELLNNLAWVYAQMDHADHEEALKLIDRALSAHPNAAELLETRGNVLIRLKRWDEAITDLERALGQLPGRSRLHSLLSEAYKQIGDDATAKMHERLASESDRVLQ